MPLHLERINWMPSPPLAPDDGPLDMAHLGRMTLGDANLKREVLAMFAGQSAGLIGALATLPADASALAHTLKGSARAIGAFRVADAAEGLEAVLRDDADASAATSEALAVLNDSIAEVRAEIDAILRRS
jgi:HPt (histidine-containing phosphotransfer) domain-containing protein